MLLDKLRLRTPSLTQKIFLEGLLGLGSDGKGIDTSDSVEHMGNIQSISLFEPLDRKHHGISDHVFVVVRPGSCPAFFVVIRIEHLIDHDARIDRSHVRIEHVVRERSGKGGSQPLLIRRTPDPFVDLFAVLRLSGIQGMLEFVGHKP
jgi:hypothetical protein